MTTARRARPRTCAGCGAVTARELPAGRLRRVTGPERVSPIRATVEGSGPARCPECGTARVDRTHLADAVRAAIAERLVSGVGNAGAARCGTCGAGLDLPMRATRRSLTVSLRTDPPFTITVELPLVRCGECAIDNVPPELVDDVERATLAACGIAPAPERSHGALRWHRRRV